MKHSWFINYSYIQIRINLTQKSQKQNNKTRLSQIIVYRNLQKYYKQNIIRCLYTIDILQ